MHAGITLNSNEFFIYYFTFTGIHLLQVIAGMGLVFFCLDAHAQGKHQDSDIALIEIGVSFWHLVDLLWIVLFALLYLIR